MKRAIVMSVLGAAACLIANRAAAQGSVFFANYSGGGTTAPVTFTGPAFGGYTSGETIGSGGTMTAHLLYSLDGGVTFNPVNVNSTAPWLTSSGTGLASGGGLFGGLSYQATISSYSAGVVDFQIQVYNGANYAASTVKGESGLIVLSGLGGASSGGPVGDFFSDNNKVTTPMTAFTVSAVPEPTTMALGGLGLAALLIARRKKA